MQLCMLLVKSHSQLISETDHVARNVLNAMILITVLYPYFCCISLLKKFYLVPVYVIFSLRLP